MKTVFLTTILMLSYRLCFAQNDFYYQLTLSSGKDTKAGKLFVAYEIAGKKYVDSVAVNAKRPVINKKLPQPVAATLYTDQESIHPVPVFLANNTLQVTIGDAGIKVDKTKLQEDFLKLIENDRVRPRYFPLYGELTAKNDTAGLSRLSVIFDSLKTDDVKKAAVYFSNNKTSLLSFLAFTRLTSSLTNPPEIENYFKQLPDWAKTSPEGKRVQLRIKGAKATQLGSKAIPFTQVSADGESINLESFKGKYVLLDFWASWCGPCRKEHPNLTLAYEELKDKGFEIISVSLDTNEKAWLGAIQKDNMNWTNLSNLKGFENEVAVKYGVQVLPANFLIDPNGVIIGKDLKGEELVSQLEAIMER